MTTASPSLVDPQPQPQPPANVAATCRNLIMAWVLTLPVSIALSASLFWLFCRFT